jgi:hypothetical protein
VQQELDDQAVDAAPKAVHQNPRHAGLYPLAAVRWIVAERLAGLPAVFDWRLLVTLIGWITLVRSPITTFKPQWIVTAGTAILGSSGIFLVAAVMNLVIGVVLSYFGYAA